MSILVIHPGALGDIVLSLPALRILRSVFPDDDIAIAGNLDYLSAVAGGYADRFISLSTLPLHRLFSGATPPPDEASFWRSFDRILSYTGYGDAQLARSFTGIHPNVLMANWKPERGTTRHVAQVFADSLRPWLGRREKVSPAEILLDTERRSAGIAWLMERGWDGNVPPIALHPGAGSEAKRWPKSRFRCLAVELSRRWKRGRLLCLDGPAEPGLGREAAASLAPDSHILAESLPLDQLASVLAACKAFVGNDSGIAHLAAGLGLPCLLFFGPTAPEQWAPLSDRITTIRRAEGCAACLECRPTGHTCLAAISVRQAVGSLETWIAGLAP